MFIFNNCPACRMHRRRMNPGCGCGCGMLPLLLLAVLLIRMILYC